jgi:hypothetical protein
MWVKFQLGSNRETIKAHSKIEKIGNEKGMFKSFGST